MKGNFRIVLASLPLMTIAIDAHARGHGGHFSSFLGGVIVCLVIGFVSYLLFGLVTAEEKWASFPNDGGGWFGLGMLGLVVGFLGLYFWAFGMFVWGTYTNRIPVVSSVFGLAMFGAICFFVLRTLFRLVRKTRTQNLKRRFPKVDA